MLTIWGDMIKPDKNSEKSCTGNNRFHAIQLLRINSLRNDTFLSCKMFCLISFCLKPQENILSSYSITHWPTKKSSWNEILIYFPHRVKGYQFSTAGQYALLPKCSEVQGLNAKYPESAFENHLYTKHTNISEHKYIFLSFQLYLCRHNLQY